MHNYSIIIPTHNRHAYLGRSIEYFKDFNAEIVYLDSTTKAYEGSIPSGVRYFHVPDMSFPEKMNFGILEVSSDHVAFCADDDYLIERAVSNGVDVLKRSVSLKAAVGNYGCFNEEFDGKFYQLYSKRGFEVIGGAPLENARQFFSNYHMILWGLFEKGSALEAYQMVRAAKLRNDNFIELILGAVCCAKGGVAIIDELWGVREVNSGDHWGGRHSSLALIDSDKKIQEDLARVESLLDEKVFQGYVREVMDSYLGFCEKRRRGRGGSCGDSLRQFLPRVCKKVLRYFLYRLNKSNSLLPNRPELLSIGESISKSKEFFDS